MRRMHKSDMCGVNKSLPYIAMVPLGCPQPTLSGMVPLCRCAQLFRPMFSRKSGVVKCISRNAVDAANILWLISGISPFSPQPPTAQNTAFPAPRSQSWRAVHNTLPPTTSTPQDTVAMVPAACDRQHIARALCTGHCSWDPLAGATQRQRHGR